MAFMRIGYTPAGVPAVYEPRLADHEDDTFLGQTGIDDVLNALPDIIKTGGDAAATIYRAVNPTTTYPSTYTAGVGGGMLGGSGLLLLGAGALLLFALSGKKRR